MTSASAALPQASEGHIQVSPLVWAWQISAILSMLIFTSFSSLDLWFSSVFFDGTRFDAADLPSLELIRQVIWRGSVLLALICLLGAGAGQFGIRLFRVSPRRWRYSVALFLIGPVLIVNEGLKNFWGRARPADIVDFGGAQTFTPALVPTDQCARNCSFASGEGSGAVAFAIVVWVLTEDMPRNHLRTALRISAIVIALVGSFLRVATGRHFLSDTIFAALIVTGLALLLRPLLPQSTIGKS